MWVNLLNTSEVWGVQTAAKIKIHYFSLALTKYKSITCLKDGSQHTGFHLRQGKKTKR